MVALQHALVQPSTFAVLCGALAAAQRRIKGPVLRQKGRDTRGIAWDRHNKCTGTVAPHFVALDRVVVNKDDRVKAEVELRAHGGDISRLRLPVHAPVHDVRV